jgi:NAD(P)-dependent dehydrogenase (short-subunit alcohol dehydrogenase family)
MIDLTSKTILVTGASSGIGQATAILCDSFGASVIISGRNEERLIGTLSQMSERTQMVIADLTDDIGISKLVDAVPKINGLFHGVGMIQPYPIKFIKRKNIEELLNTNLTSAILLTSNLLKNKKVSNSSSFVFISSVSANHPYLGGALYSTSKAALEAFTRSVALEHANQKIRANILAPALVQTDMFNKTKEAYSEDEFQQIITQYPLGIGQPLDVARAAVFLLSEASSWITGTTLQMDGGLLLNSKR